MIDSLKFLIDPSIIVALAQLLITALTISIYMIILGSKY